MKYRQLLNNVEGGNTLYKKYEELLRRTGKTSYQVSKDTRIGENILSYWKNGRSKPKTDKLKILADYFGVSIDYFLDEPLKDTQQVGNTSLTKE